MSTGIKTGRLPDGSANANSLDPRAENEVQDQRASALVERDALSALTATKGWSMLCAWMQEQIRLRVDLIMLQPSRGPETQLEQEFTKGECAAYRTLMEVVKIGIETSKAVVESIDAYGPDPEPANTELQDE